MNLIDFLNQKFSSPKLQHLSLTFYEAAPAGHHRDFLYVSTPSSSFKLMKMASSYINLENNDLKNHLEKKDEVLSIDKDLGCLVSEKILEFKLHSLLTSYKSSWSELFNDLTQPNISEIIFDGEYYQINFTKETFHNGFQVLDLDGYEKYIENTIKNGKLNSLKDLLSCEYGYYINVVSKDPQKPIKNYLITPDFKRKLIKEINSCLLVLASKNLCLHLSKNYFDISQKYTNSQLNINNTFPIPLYNYDYEATSFYKLAKSSIYPSQKFLHLYHVLEFYFLKTSENELHEIIKSKIANPNFLSQDRSINEIINSVKKFQIKSDEEEKLRIVLKKAFDGANLLEEINKNFPEFREKYNSKRKIFGKDFSIRFEDEHIIGNLCKIIKHLRNALVHSSDLYDREECYVPFSSCEDIYADFTDLIDFIALSVLSYNSIKI